MKVRLGLLIGAAGLGVAARHRRSNTVNDSHVRHPAPMFLADQSRDELYAQAKALEIPGRSRMRKADLERALAERMSGAAA